jgi:hypothetical protein
MQGVSCTAQPSRIQRCKLAAVAMQSEQQGVSMAALTMSGKRVVRLTTCDASSLRMPSWPMATPAAQFK